MSRIAALRALAARRSPSDEHVVVECPRCDAPMVAYTAYGRFDCIISPCESECYRTYSEQEYAEDARDAEDAIALPAEPDDDER